MDFRTVQRLEGDKWVNIEFNQLRLDDNFRMFESTGEQVIGLGNTTEWVATSNPFLDKDNKMWMIETNMT